MYLRAQHFWQEMKSSSSMNEVEIGRGKMSYPNFALMFLPALESGPGYATVSYSYKRKLSYGHDKHKHEVSILFSERTCIGHNLIPAPRQKTFSIN